MSNKLSIYRVEPPQPLELPVRAVSVESAVFTKDYRVGFKLAPCDLGIHVVLPNVSSSFDKTMLDAKAGGSFSISCEEARALANALLSMVAYAEGK